MKSLLKQIERLLEDAKALQWLEDNAEHFYYRLDGSDSSKNGLYVRAERLPNWNGSDLRFNSLRNAALYTMREDERARETAKPYLEGV